MKHSRSWLCLFLTLALLLLATGGAAASGRPVDPGAVPAQKVSPSPGKVRVGLYLRALPELDIKTNSYLADFYLWFRWHAAQRDPSASFEFTNAVQSWDLKIQPLHVDDLGVARAEALPDGSRYQIFHVHGRFQTPFDLRSYPFDRQSVRIELEETNSLVGVVAYEWDRDGDAVHPGLTIPGWTIESARAEVGAAGYPTHFGDIRKRGSHDEYARFAFVLDVERPIIGYLVKTVLPISVVMLITFITFFIELRYFEARIGLAITGLISAVALQLTSGSELPNVGYMVLLDKIYNLSYFVIFIALAESVAAVRLADAGFADRARRLDRWAVLACAVIFFGGAAVITLSGA